MNGSLFLIFLLIVLLFPAMVQIYAHKRIFPGNRTVFPLPADTERFFLNLSHDSRVEILELSHACPAFQLLFIHGNGANAYTSFDLGRALRTKGGHVFLLNLPGYGYSTGKPSERTVVEAAVKATEYILNKYSDVPLFLLGQSLGGAVAIQAASAVKPDGLIVESSFSSVKDMAYYTLGKPGFLHFFVRHRFDNISVVQKLEIPKLFMHAREDKVVPFELGDRLYQAAAKPKQRAILDLPGHCNYFDENPRQYLETIGQFIREEQVKRKK